MKFLKFILILFISLTTLVKADSKKNIIENLKVGGKLIFIRHAYAPGGGDPENFDIDDCSTQRNLSENGRIQSRKIGNFKEAEKFYLTGLNIKPDHNGINEYLGELYVQTNQIDKANERLNVLKNCNCKEYNELELIIKNRGVKVY